MDNSDNTLHYMNVSHGTIVRYDGTDTNLVIPEPVKEIGLGVFSGNTRLEFVSLPIGFESLDKRCFDHCTSLREVIFSADLSRIGEYAFSGCRNLVIETLPPALRAIEPYTFKNCTSLTSLTIPESVRKIDIGAFSGCTGLTDLFIPESVEELSSAFGMTPFTGCSNLTIHAPAGSEAERFAKTLGIPVDNETVPAKAGMPDGLRRAPSDGALSKQAGEQQKVRFLMKMPVAKEKKGTGAKVEKPQAAETGPDLEAEKQRRIEQERLKEAEKQRRIEQERLKEAEAKRKAEEQKLREAEERRKAEQQKQKNAEAKQKAEQMRLRKEEEALRKAELQRKKEEEKRRKAELQRKKEEEKRRKAEDRRTKAAEKEQRSGNKKPAVAILLAIVLLAAAASGAMLYKSYIAGDHSSDGNGAQTADYTLTLEDYLNNNENARQQVLQSVEGTDLSISVSGNTLIYTDDLSKSEGMTAETVKSEEMRKVLEEALDSGDDRFIELCAGLEKDTGISGISVKVIYSFGDEVIISREYTSEGKK